MKKAIKFILPSAAGAICIAFWIYTLNMIGTVNGEKIFFLNSALGNFYASAYRIFAAVSLVLLIVWILVAVKKVPKLIALIKSKLTKEQTGERPSEENENDDSADLKNDSFVDVPEDVPLVEEKIVAEKPVLQVPLTEKVVEEVVDPFEPAVVSAQAPVSDSAAPVSDSAAPVSDLAAPVSDSAALVSDSAAPGSGSAAPGSGSAAPGSDSAAPGSGPAAPGSGSAAPGSDSAAPGSGSAAPGSGSAAPVSDSAAPGSDSAAPGSGSAAPGSGSAAPVSDSAAPDLGSATSDTSPEDDNIICTKCGKSIPGKAKFCPFCGNKNS